MRYHSSTTRRQSPSRAIAWLAASATLAIAGPAAAQAPEAEREPDRWAAAAEFTLTATDGNQDVTVLTTGFTLRRLQSETFGFDLKLQARYGSSGGEPVAENYQGTFNIDIAPGNRWSPFLYSTAEHDPFKRLDVRVNSGAGAKYRLYRAEDRGEASLSLAMLHSYEALAPEDDLVDGTATTRARWSLRLTGRQQLHEGVTVTSEALYEPIFDHARDYLLEVDAALKVLVTRRIALSITHEFNRDNTPAEGVERDDRLLRAGVLIEL